MATKNQMSKSSKNTKAPSTDSFPYDYICVIDFEATCIKNGGDDFKNEIIEFPIVVINVETNKIEALFREYVRPVINPKLSEFCSELTGIMQQQVDNAGTFPEVLSKVNQWFTQKQFGTKYKFVVASDGPWDFQKFMNLQCYLSKIEYPYWATNWIDIRKLFAKFFKVKKCGINKMLEHLGLKFQGSPHSGLDDSQNIARILTELRDHGCNPIVNSQIEDSLSPIQNNPFSKGGDNSNDDVIFV